MARHTEADIARLFHLHSSHERTRVFEPRIDLDTYPAHFRTYPGAPRTALPGKDFALEMTLGAALERRCSIRDYQLRPLPLETLGRLLHTTYGVRGRRPVDEEIACDRPAPSAGGKYPVELYVAAQSVEGLADGVYHYDARAHELEHVREGLAQPAIAELLMDQDFARDANLIVILAAIRERTMWKYGQRGYRHVFLDAGHVGQNLYLVSTALGLGPTGIGGFFDQELGAFLRLPEGEEPFYVVCIGQPAPEKAST